MYVPIINIIRPLTRACECVVCWAHMQLTCYTEKGCAMALHYMHRVCTTCMYNSEWLLCNNAQVSQRSGYVCCRNIYIYSQLESLMCIRYAGAILEKGPTSMSVLTPMHITFVARCKYMLQSKCSGKTCRAVRMATIMTKTTEAAAWQVQALKNI